MIVRTLKENVDERFLVHRLRATSLAGVVGGVTASLLFAYYYFAQQDPRWDLLAVAVIMAVVKLSTLAYYRFTD
jgi:uncharacterized membrane protein YeaQ/YmgE (transglycosylase-associated protein family)